MLFRFNKLFISLANNLTRILLLLGVMTQMSRILVLILGLLSFYRDQKSYNLLGPKIRSYYD